MKRVLSIILSGMMLFILFTGCSSDATTIKGTEPISTSSSTNTSATTKTAEKMVISFIGGYFTDFNLYENSYVVKTIEDAVGIDLKLINVSVKDKEALALMFASKEYPDCAWYRLQDPYNLYYNEQLTRSVPQDMLAKYAPNYYKMITATYPELTQMYLDKNDKTKRYALTGLDLSAGMYQYYWNSWYRNDWIQKFGIKMPDAIELAYTDVGSVYATDRGMDIDTFRTYLDKSVHNDPDGNGIDDTYGIVGTDCYVTPLMAAFGVYRSWSNKCNQAENGETEMWYAQDGFRDYLAYMADLYANGLIDKEIFTLDSAQANAKLKSGKVAYMTWTANTTTSAYNGTDKFPACLVESDPGISLLIAASEVGRDGQYGCAGYSDYIAYEHFTISNKVNDAKLAKILEFFDYTNTIGRYDYTYGKKGETWNYDDHGKPAYVKEVEKKLGNDSQTIWKQSLTFRQFMCDEFYLEWCNDYQFRTIEKYAIGKDSIWCKKMKHSYRSDPYNSTNLLELEAKYSANIEEYIDEYVASVVSGAVKLESTWDQYIKAIDSLGYAEIKTVLQKCPKTSDILGMP